MTAMNEFDFDGKLKAYRGRRQVLLYRPTFVTPNLAFYLRICPAQQSGQAVLHVRLHDDLHFLPTTYEVLASEDANSRASESLQENLQESL